MPLQNRIFPALPLAALVAFAVVSPGAAQADGPALSVDANPAGNTPASLGSIESCAAVSNGDMFQADLVIEDVQDLLAWEIYIEYDPQIVEIAEQDVRLFQEANVGSSVIDVSDRLPDPSGYHRLSAFDASDPPRTDSGSGVLARLTLRAIAAGESPLSIATRDINGDGTLDRGALLRDADTNVIGDEDGDSFFDGERNDAMVAVDGECPPGTSFSSPLLVTPSSVGSGSSPPWLLISLAAGAAAALATAAAGALLFFRRTSRATT